MKNTNRTFVMGFALLMLGGAIFMAPSIAGQGRGQVTALAPKPAQLTPYTAPHKPHWKLTEILAQQAGKPSWSLPIVDDPHLKAQYISMAPGESTPTKFYADNPAWWVVQDGQIRFTIDGQEPFVASKGFLVQVPYRVPFKMETVGDKPSLRFEVTVAGASVLYPSDGKPQPMDGVQFVPVRFTGRGAYTEQTRPYLDFIGQVVNGTARAGGFVTDDRGFANVIRGRGTPRPPDTQKGHFHLDYAEFWFVLEGQIDYLIEGLPFFSAQQGDIVYVPKGRFHRASFGGEGMATRLAINGYPQGLHNEEAPQQNQGRGQ
jgi:mannose-6-phosphate isomerase-like protein (cupin superfamily)